MLSRLIGEEAVDSWRFLDAREITIGGQAVFAVRITYTGELGWELYIPRQAVSSVYEARCSRHDRMQPYNLLLITLLVIRRKRLFIYLSMSHD